MAALMPHTTPWSNALRGSSDGVTARQADTSATQAPGRVYRNRRRRPPAASGGDAARRAVSSCCAVIGPWSCRL
jgi:hypothetical protein